jgi:hypothetical protein
VTAHEDPEIDPQHDAASIDGAPETAEEAARARDLAELFAPLAVDEESSSDVDDDASREHLAALFAGPTAVPAAAASTDSEPDFAGELAPVFSSEPAFGRGPDFSSEPASAWAADPEVTADAAAEPVEAEPAPVAKPVRGARKSRTADADTVALAGGAVAASGLSPVEVPGAPGAATTAAEPTDPLAWLDRVEQHPTATPEKAALGSWLGAGEGAGSFSPAPRRGIRAWSSRVRWSVAVSIVLLIGVVAASVVIAQTVSANNLAAQRLAAAVAELDAAEESATQPESVLDEAVGQYDDTVETARATADSAGPPLAALAGMAAQPQLDASNAALAALVAQLDATSLGDMPEPYARGDVDMSDIEQVRAATETAKDHAALVTTTTREVRAAQAALQEKLDALRVAQVALGASLPATADLIVGENRRALQSFRDAVIAASVAVPAAQNAGGSGDAEMLAYAAAVTALRNDQTRAETGTTPVTPPTTNPAPAPDPAPVPDPVPVPEPTPTPTETTPPPPSPTDPPIP